MTAGIYATALVKEEEEGEEGEEERRGRWIFNVRISVLPLLCVRATHLAASFIT